MSQSHRALGGTGSVSDTTSVSAGASVASSVATTTSESVGSTGTSEGGGHAAHAGQQAPPLHMCASPNECSGGWWRPARRYVPKAPGGTRARPRPGRARPAGPAPMATATPSCATCAKPCSPGASWRSPATASTPPARPGLRRRGRPVRPAAPDEGRLRTPHPRASARLHRIRRRARQGPRRPRPQGVLAGRPGPRRGSPAEFGRARCPTT